MKVLLIGAGSKWGLTFTKYIKDQGHEVDLVTSKVLSLEGIDSYKISWNNLNTEEVKNIASWINSKQTEYDLIFFNHNSYTGVNENTFKNNSSLPNLNSWNQAYFNHCQMPVLLLKLIGDSIKNETKIGWMITGMVNRRQPEQFQHGLYASAKHTNQSIMRLFNLHQHKGIFFVIDPIWFEPGGEMRDARSILNVINKIDEGGHCWSKDGQKLA